MSQNLVRFSQFCRLAKINRTQLFQIMNKRQLKVTVIHGNSFVCSDEAAIRKARKKLGLELIQEKKNGV